MEEKHLHDLFGKYHAGTLSVEEQEDFDKLIEDPSVRQELELYELVNEAVEDYNFLKLKQQMELDLKDINPQNKWWKFAGIGAVIFLIMFSFVLMDNPFKKQNDDHAKLALKKNSMPLPLTEESNIDTKGDSVDKPVSSQSKNSFSNKLTNKSPKKELIEAVNKENTTSTLPAPQVVANEDLMQQSVEQIEPKVQYNKAPSVTPENVKSEEPATPIGIQVKDIEIHVEPSCKDKATGEVKVKNIITEPENANVTILFENKKIQVGNSLTNLPSGTYAVNTEINGKLSTFSTIFIAEKECLDRDEFIVAPAMGEVWRIPVKEYGDVQIMVMDQKGVVYKTLQIKDQFPDSWDLMTDQDAILQEGYYVLLITGHKGTFKRFLRVIK